MRRSIAILVALGAAISTAPASAATLWNVITTDSTYKTLKGVKVTDAAGETHSLSRGITYYSLVPIDHITHAAEVHTDFDGPGGTANRVRLHGDGADTIEAGMIAKYGAPDSREVIHRHSDPMRSIIGVLPGTDEDHIVMKWTKDIRITFERQAAGAIWDASYEAITSTPAQAAASL